MTFAMLYCYCPLLGEFRYRALYRENVAPFKSKLSKDATNILQNGPMYSKHNTFSPGHYSTNIAVNLEKLSAPLDTKLVL